jgi:hypothetical protein
MSVADVLDGAPLPASQCHRLIVADELHEGAVQMQVTTIGLDIAENVFQVHGSIQLREGGSSGGMGPMT